MRKKILIVDDEQEVAELIKDRAKAHHIDCEIDLTGEQCVEKVKTFSPDLVLLDMNLPMISGFGIIRELKSDAALATIPIIILSALSQKDVVREALDMGAKAYFVKSGSMADLFKLIREYI